MGQAVVLGRFESRVHVLDGQRGEGGGAGQRQHGLKRLGRLVAQFRTVVGRIRQGIVGASLHRTGGNTVGAGQRSGHHGIPNIVGHDGVEVHPSRFTIGRKLVDRCRDGVDADEITKGVGEGIGTHRSVDPGKTRRHRHGVEERRALERLEQSGKIIVIRCNRGQRRLGVFLQQVR